MICDNCGHDNIEGARFCANCGLPVEQERGSDWVGRLVGGRFRVTRVLGEGGMGVVYAGEQQMGSTVRKVAIKTLHPHLSRDPSVLARFHRECGTVAELEHPNTIKVYDFGATEDGTLYIAMEFVEGRSLDKVIEAEGPLKPSRVVKILEQISGALDEAHALGIVHRDLKPENIILGARLGNPDFVKVLDFGIAARSESSDREREQKLTQQGMVLGTPPYMSPEQFTGQELDKRSDIYSLGVMTYEMLTGRLPFHASTPWQWATEHMTAMPFPIEQTASGSGIPPTMREVVMRCLAKRPEERAETAGAFVRELAAGLQGGEVAPMSFARTEAMQAASTTGAAVKSSGGFEPAELRAAGLPSSAALPRGVTRTEEAVSTTQPVKLPVKGGSRLPLVAGLVLVVGGASGIAYTFSKGAGPAEGTGGESTTASPTLGTVDGEGAKPVASTGGISGAEPEGTTPPETMPSGHSTPPTPTTKPPTSNPTPTTKPPTSNPTSTPTNPTQPKGTGGGANGSTNSPPPQLPTVTCGECPGFVTQGNWSQAKVSYGKCDTAGKSQCSALAKRQAPTQVKAAGENCSKIRAIVQGAQALGASSTRIETAAAECK